MSETPRTDAAAIHCELHGHPLFKSIDYVTLGFARQLERELAGALKARDAAIEYEAEAQKKLARVEKQLEEANRKLVLMEAQTQTLLKINNATTAPDNNFF